MNQKLELLATQLAELQVSEVVSLIKLISEKCDIDLLAMMQESAPSAPANTASEESEDAPKKKLYTLKLVEFNPTNKAEIIKTMRVIMGGNVSLSDVKSKVEALPIIVKKDIKEEEMQETKALFDKMNAKLEISES